jgi:hypothetical protein
MTEAEFARIKALISKRLASPRNELEARLFPVISGQDVSIDYYQFNRILSRYTFRKDLGGFGLKKVLTTQLNVKSNRIPDLRESIKGEDAVKAYWLKDDIDLVAKNTPNCVFRQRKRKGEVCDLSNYAVRIALSDEQDIPAKNGTHTFEFLSNKEFPKHYRLQNRVSLYTEDGLFRMDFTSVKQATGRSFRHSKVLTAFPIHEIEIEYIGPPTANKDAVFNNFIHHLSVLLSIYYESPILITRALQEQENARDDPHIPNILRNYAVTYKADGERNLLFIIPGQKGKELVEGQAEEGSMFLLNNTFRVLPVGFNNKTWVNSIIEGEYIRESRSFYAYDMLYAKGLDIRNKPLESFGTKQSSRLQYLREFVTELNEDIKDKKVTGSIKIAVKPYLFGNGEEIFLRSNQLWSKKASMPYHVDGMIYTPGTEPYPSTGRTWPQLFKWKPPELNTIDFLIEIVKGENGKDRLYPYIKLETVGEKAKDTSPYKVTQYKILKLKVGGMKEKFNRRTNRVQRKWGPIPFAEYPEAKIPVDDLGRIIARDPLHKIVTEVLDDTIVEFSYHAEREFPWVPIRVRHEKTTLYRSTYSTFGNVAATAKRP